MRDTATLPASTSELDDFLREHPQVEFVDAMFTDMCGIVRGKRLTPDHARRLYAEGLQLPGSMLYLSVTGSCLDPLGRGVSDGDPDVTVRALPGTLRAIPWARRPGAQVQIGVDGEESGFGAFEPRQILARVADRFAELSLAPVVACELEFCLVDPEMTAGGMPQPPTACRGTQLMSLSSVDDFEPFIEEVTAMSRAFGVPMTALNAEYGAGQFEMNLHHTADAVRAADDAVSLKQVVQAVAAHHGMRASFMAKPYAEQAGSGMHWHVSLVDAQGRNAFDDESLPSGQATLQHAVAGVLATMPEAMAFGAPNVNSYKRFRPGLFVPMSASWGYNNRGVALRIPAGAASDRRLEYRLPGADANPYLALAALLAGVHHGVAGRLVPPAPREGNPAARADGSLPLRLYDALRVLESARVLPDYLGADYLALYAECKRLEADELLSALGEREVSWYLRPES